MFATVAELEVLLHLVAGVVPLDPNLPRRGGGDLSQTTFLVSLPTLCGTLLFHGSKRLLPLSMASVTVGGSGALECLGAIRATATDSDLRC